MARSLFDRVVVVDWSAASTPTRGRDSIWVADAVVDAAPTNGRSGARLRAVNLATRHEAAGHLVDLASTPGERLLIAVDFSLGYPRGTADAFGLTGSPWEAVWAHLSAAIDDDARNRNNRFAVASALNRRFGEGPGPFWGCPSRLTTPWLGSKKASPDPLPTWRSTESVLRCGGARPFSSWQLLGAGSVGSQSLLGIPALSHLRTRLGEVGVEVQVWPFTTGLCAPRIAAGQVVIAEAWPSMADHRPAERAGAVRDEAQVLTLARNLSSDDAQGRLARWFVPTVAPGDIDAVVGEEGWILGVGSSVIDS